MPESIGLVVVGRPTFDLESAEPLVASLADHLSAQWPVEGDTQIRTTVDEVEAGVSFSDDVWGLVIAFATFCDATVAMKAAEKVGRDVPIVVWSFPEEWTGARLSRNSFCGANLAAHSLVADGRRVAGWHGEPSAAGVGEAAWRLQDLRVDALGARFTDTFDVSGVESAHIDAAVDRLDRAIIGVVGAPPVGFDPCRLPPDDRPFSTRFETVGLDELRRPTDDPAPVTTSIGHLCAVAGSNEVDDRELASGALLHAQLEGRMRQRRWDAVAFRCWPECFDRRGTAACSAMSMLNDEGHPVACESDALGAATMLLMESLSGRPVFLADLVDVDPPAGEVVVWHCGVAPRSMAAGEVRVTVHPNRAIGPVFDFGLAPGRVTIGRISQDGQDLRMVIGSGEIIGDKPFRGTSAVVRLDGATSETSTELVDTIIEEGLEHHYVVAAGDVAADLAAVAERWGIPVVAISGAQDRSSVPVNR